jgi:hypothetical protein
MEKLLEHLGYATPFIYAAAAYGLFAWLTWHRVLQEKQQAACI